MVKMLQVGLKVWSYLQVGPEKGLKDVWSTHHLQKVVVERDFSFRTARTFKIFLHR